MRFGHIELFVADPVRARDFYVGVLGAELEAEQGPKGQPPVFIWLLLGGATILLRPGAPREHQEFSKSAADYVIYCDDVEEQAGEWRARGLKFAGNDGPGCLTFRDPDGHWFQLVNPGDK